MMSYEQGFKGDLKQGIFNAKNENLKALEALFPSAVKDGQLDVEALREELGQFEEVGAEKYGLTWSGKQNAKKIALEDSIGRTLKFVPEESVNLDTTENLYIEGDNLEVLKLLRQNYYGAIKMIYIDPPYNTGNDFVYKDQFNMDAVESDVAEGCITEEQERLQRNLKSTNRFHANWLNMMYPRLRVAKDLLSEDGAIVISIDDNEIKDLKMLCDEIFGEGNFIASLIWKSRQNKDNRSLTGVSIDHEYLLCYAKSNETRMFKGSERKTEAYKNPDNDVRGAWTSANMVGLLPEELRPNCHYDLINPFTEMNYGKPNMGWRYDKNTMNRLIKEDRILWPEDSSGRPRRKVFLNELSDNLPGFSSIVCTDVFTKDGTAEIDKLFEKRIFDFPKPTKLLCEMVQQITCKDENAIILDFFSGSATIAQAIFECNKIEDGNRHVIMVQIPERLSNKDQGYKLGYKNICEIGKERIRRAGNKIKKEIEETNAKLQIGDTPKAIPDIGFKVFKTADTMIRWNYEDIQLQRAYLELAATSEVLEGQSLVGTHMMNHKDQLDFMPYATDVDVVYEILLRHRDIPLSASIEQLAEIGKRTYLFANSFLVCLETEITTELIEKIAALRPLPVKFVLRDSAFEDDINLKDETIRRFKALVARNTNKKQSAYTVEFI